MHSIADYLCRLRFGEPVAHRNLVVIPLFGPESGPEVMTLGEALRRDAADVREVGERGKVNAVRVTNRSIAYVMLLAGEEILGGKQNRIVNTTIVVGPGETLEVPVTCVEKGRWKLNEREFRAARRAVPPSMRGGNAEALTSTLQLSGVWDIGQVRVWGDVDRLTQRRQAVSETQAFAAVAEQEGDDLEEFVAAIRPLPGQTGLAAYVNGRFVALDALGRQSAYAEVHDTLLRSCALEAIDLVEETGAPSRIVPNVLLEDLMQTSVIEFRSPGHGTDARLAHPRVRGAALVASDGLVHLSAFPTS